jgi:iron complex transport system permease protein
MRSRVGRLPLPPIAVLLGIVSTALALVVLCGLLPPERWLSAAVAPNPARMDEVVFAYAVLPRMAGACLAGALLGVSGAVFQQVIRNPLATPDTLAVTSGAELALAGAVLAAPQALAAGRLSVAFAGGALAVALVLGLSWRSRFAAVPVLLVGLAATLYLDAVTTLLILFKAHDLSGLLVWAGGSLAVQDWRPVTVLALWSIALVACLAPLVRPLALFSLDDASVGALGGNVAAIRVGCLGLAVAMTAVVNGTFGAIGFVGLAAPALARMAGVSQLAPRLVWSAALGGLMLWGTDSAATLISAQLGLDLPTGAAMAVLGSPLLVGLAVLQREGTLGTAADATTTRRSDPRLLLAGLAAALAVAVAAALLLGRSAHGWTLSWPGPDLTPLLPWRAPRTMGAAAGGALLGLSGFLLQRVSGNPMAAPEMLGVSAGAGCGLFLAVFMGGGLVAQNAAAIAGAAAVALALLAWITLARVEPNRLLITGLAIATAVASLVGVFGATGDPRALQLMAWMAGSTYRLSAPAAELAATAALLALPGLLLAARWLDLMPLGPTVRVGLGLPESHARRLLVLFAAVLAGCAASIVGPLSFVGLVAPRIAFASGLTRARSQGLGAMLTGALLMAVADVVGRTALFPWQAPSGIMAALLGAPLLIFLMK